MPSIFNKWSMWGGRRPFGTSRRETKGRRAVEWFLEFLAVAILMWVVLVTAGRVLPQMALKQISALTNTRISTESVDFRFNGFVYIKGLVVRPQWSADYDNSILKAETVQVRFGIGSLMKFRPRLKEIYVDNFVLRAQYDTNNGEWNLSALKIEMPSGGKWRLPFIWFENGAVEYSRVVEGRERMISRSPVSARFSPAEKLIGGYSFDISGAKQQSFAGSSIFGSWQPGRVVVGGRISSKDLPGFERPWMLKSLNAEMNYEPNGACALTAKIKDFAGPPNEEPNLFAFDTTTIADKVPFINALQEFFNRHNPSGNIDIDLQVNGNLTKLNELAVTGKVHCKDVTICDRGFPYLVEHVKGQVELTDKSARLKGLSGRHGDVEFVVEGWAENSESSGWKYDLEITSNNMTLDQDVYDALTQEEKKLWSAFSPKGAVAVKYSRSQTSPTDSNHLLAVHLLNVDGKYTEFAYPLKNMGGTLYFTAGNIRFADVVSQWEGRTITINGTVGIVQGEQPRYDFLIKGENIPLDETLKDALPPAQREFYNQFETSGRFDTMIKVLSSAETWEEGTFVAEIYPKNSDLKAKMLPILVSDVTGKIVIKPDVMDIGGLFGRYGNGRIVLSGKIWPAVEKMEAGYCLSMQAKEVELSDELVGTLPGSLGSMLGELRPGGRVSVTADVSQNAREKCVDNRLIIECLNSTLDCNLLPYPLGDISGKITITPSQIELEDVIARGTHKVRGEVAQSMMKMTGRIVLSEEVAGKETPASPDASRGVRITTGDVNFSGENVRVKGKTLSKVDTAMEYNTELGQWLSKYFIADFYGGKITGRIQLNQSGEGGLDYLFEASVTGAGMKQLLMDTEKEIRPDEHYSSGSISGSLSVVGSTADNTIHLGRCRLKIVDMEVGKLSPLAKVLTVLNLTEPRDYAFEQMLVDAYIQNNRMFFRQLDLSGKSLAFSGSGWLDLKTDEINLILAARGQRLATASPSLLQSLTEGLSRAVIKVEVNGQAGDPQVKVMPLPAIKETLKIFGTPKGE